ncbi:MAG: hypothetical protein HQK55_14620 [Deltaproteobacteria bacterium]|nr:hypothetical protein [Deltaproteobacteria bacterium]
MWKKFIALIGFIFLTGCFSSGMNLSYLTPQETPFKARPIFLKVNDKRTDKNIVTPAVLAKDLFKDVGDRLSLTGKTTDGRTTAIKDATVKDALYEAFRLRMEALGLGVLPAFSEDNLSLVIDLEKVVLDLEGSRTFKAEVAYIYRISDGTKEVKSGKITGSTEKFYVLGQQDGEESLSGALNNAVNNMDMRLFMSK